MTEQEKILKAAEKFAEDNGERITNVKEYLTHNDLQNSFTDGASFYAKEVMPGMMEKLLAWALVNGYETNDKRSWIKIGKSRSVIYTTAELVTKFLADKQKQDATKSENK